MSKSTKLIKIERGVNLRDIKESIAPTDNFWDIVGKISNVSAKTHIVRDDSIHAVNKLAYIMYQTRFIIPNEDELIERALGISLHCFLHLGHVLLFDEGRDHVASLIASFGERSMIQTSDGKQMSANIKHYMPSSKMAQPDEVYTTMQLMYKRGTFFFIPSDNEELNRLILKINPYEALCKLINTLYNAPKKIEYHAHEYKEIIQLLSFGTTIICHLCRKMKVDATAALRSVFNSNGDYSAYHGVRQMFDFRGLDLIDSKRIAQP
jgi:hypothetical protein